MISRYGFPLCIFLNPSLAKRFHRAKLFDYKLESTSSSVKRVESPATLSVSVSTVKWPLVRDALDLCSLNAMEHPPMPLGHVINALNAFSPEEGLDTIEEGLELISYAINLHLDSDSEVIQALTTWLKNQSWSEADVLAACRLALLNKEDIILCKTCFLNHSWFWVCVGTFLSERKFKSFEHLVIIARAATTCDNLEWSDEDRIHLIQCVIDELNVRPHFINDLASVILYIVPFSCGTLKEDLLFEVLLNYITHISSGDAIACMNLLSLNWVIKYPVLENALSIASISGLSSLDQYVSFLLVKRRINRSPLDKIVVNGIIEALSNHPVDNCFLSALIILSTVILESNQLATPHDANELRVAIQCAIARALANENVVGSARALAQLAEATFALNCALAIEILRAAETIVVSTEDLNEKDAKAFLSAAARIDVYDIPLLKRCLERCFTVREELTPKELITVIYVAGQCVSRSYVSADSPVSNTSSQPAELFQMFTLEAFHEYVTVLRDALGLTFRYSEVKENEIVREPLSLEDVAIMIDGLRLGGVLCKLSTELLEILKISLYICTTSFQICCKSLFHFFEFMHFHNVPHTGLVDKTVLKCLVNFTSRECVEFGFVLVRLGLRDPFITTALGCQLAKISPTGRDLVEFCAVIENLQLQKIFNETGLEDFVLCEEGLRGDDAVFLMRFVSEKTQEVLLNRLRREDGSLDSDSLSQGSLLELYTSGTNEGLIKVNVSGTEREYLLQALRGRKTVCKGEVDLGTACRVVCQARIAFSQAEKGSDIDFIVNHLGAVISSFQSEHLRQLLCVESRASHSDSLPSSYVRHIARLCTSEADSLTANECLTALSLVMDSGRGEDSALVALLGQLKWQGRALVEDKEFLAKAVTQCDNIHTREASECKKTLLVAFRKAKMDKMIRDYRDRPPKYAYRDEIIVNSE